MIFRRKPKVTGNDMIGNETDARFIRDWVRGGKHYHPEGWQRLGTGCYRAAWLHVASGVVYKVQHEATYSYQTNHAEARNIARYRFKKMPKGCRLPRYQFFALDNQEDGVMAMERFSKLLREVSYYQDPNGYYDRHKELQGVLRDVYDLHGGNLAIDEENELLVPIDLGG